MKRLRVSILGSPNTGKSSLLNELIKEKVTIVSNKAQTTQSVILGILTKKDTQIVFLDTPGLCPSTKKYNSKLRQISLKAPKMCDFCIFLFSTDQKIPQNIIEISKYINIPKIAVINKIDKYSKSKLLDLTDKLREYFDTILYTSALNGDGIQYLIDFLLKNAKEGDWEYDKDKHTNLSTEFRIKDLLKEQIFNCFYEEVPYNVEVENEKILEKDNEMIIKQNIIVKRGYYHIFLGRIKYLGEQTRKSMESTFKKKIHLYLKIMEK